MKESKRAVLAFDTSAYTTSAAAVDEDGEVIANERIMLRVKTGNRGLRQSQAFFQHMKDLPELTEKVCEQIRTAGFHICAVAASSRPRAVEGSYMPVFLAGLNTGSCAASALGVPLYRFSHQEGHIAAAAGILPADRKSLAFHLSGGTSELVTVEGSRTGHAAGGSADISFGQLIDRTGVAYGLPFPAGKYMDAAALRGLSELKYHFSGRGRRVYEEPVLSDPRVRGTTVNLSGIETSCMKAAESGAPLDRTASELFMKISDAVVQMARAACASEAAGSVIFAGGVSSSAFLREQVTESLKRAGIEAVFGEPALSADNAVGTARLGMNEFLENERRTSASASPGRGPTGH